MKKQHELLEQAIEAFQKTTGLIILAHSQTALIIAHNQRKYHFKAKIKLNLTKAALAFETRDAKEILVTHYVTPQMSEQMKDLGEISLVISTLGEISPCHFDARRNLALSFRRSDKFRLVISTLGEISLVIATLGEISLVISTLGEILSLSFRRQEKS
jgi:NADH pyrophosphatase NudC (nudix superfamily)